MYTCVHLLLGLDKNDWALVTLKFREKWIGSSLCDSLFINDKWDWSSLTYIDPNINPYRVPDKALTTE